MTTYSDIDYTNLNKRIVEQAENSSKTYEEQENDAYLVGDREKAKLLRKIIELENDLAETQYQLQYIKETYGIVD